MIFQPFNDSLFARRVKSLFNYLKEGIELLFSAFALSVLLNLLDFAFFARLKGRHLAVDCFVLASVFLPAPIHKSQGRL